MKSELRKQNEQMHIDECTVLEVCLNEDFRHSDEETRVTQVEIQVAEWCDGSTRCLIELYKDMKVLVEERKLKSMKQMWEIIHEKINSYGYSFTPMQCENKWKSLERSWKNHLKNNNKTRRSRRGCPYEKELTDILMKHSSNVPPFVMDAGTIISEDNVLQELRGSNKDIKPSTSQSDALSSKLKTSNHSGIIKEMNKIYEAIKERTELKRSLGKKTYEQREVIISELKKRNELLEQLLFTKNSNN